MLPQISTDDNTCSHSPLTAKTEIPKQTKLSPISISGKMNKSNARQRSKQIVRPANLRILPSGTCPTPCSIARYENTSNMYHNRRRNYHYRISFGTNWPTNPRYSCVTDKQLGYIFLGQTSKRRYRFYYVAIVSTLYTLRF